MAVRFKGKKRSTVNFGRRPKEKPLASKMFLPDMLTEVKAIAMRGLTDEEIANVFCLPVSLLKKWKKQYPSFKDAIEQGRTRADAEVIAALYKRATGQFTVPHTEVIKYRNHFETLDMEKHYPPDVEAAKYWLNNRSRAHWSSKTSIEATGPNGKPIEVQTKNDLIDAILDLVKPKKDDDGSR